VRRSSRPRRARFRRSRLRIIVFIVELLYGLVDARAARMARASDGKEAEADGPRALRRASPPRVTRWRVATSDRVGERLKRDHRAIARRRRDPARTRAGPRSTGPGVSGHGRHRRHTASANGCGARRRSGIRSILGPAHPASSAELAQRGPAGSPPSVRAPGHRAAARYEPTCKHTASRPRLVSLSGRRHAATSMAPDAVRLISLTRTPLSTSYLIGDSETSLHRPQPRGRQCSVAPAAGSSP
jgi:hypothetical protein